MQTDIMDSEAEPCEANEQYVFMHTFCARCLAKAMQNEHNANETLKVNFQT